jgi:cell shape-determining protein MreC
MVETAIDYLRHCVSDGEPHGSAHGWTDKHDVPTQAVCLAVADFGLEYTVTVQFRADQLADPELAAAWQKYNEAVGVIWQKLDEARAENKRLNAECDGQLDKIASRDTEAMDLRNENARLRAALRKIGNAYISEYINGEWIPSAVRNIDDAITVARAALAGGEG